MRKEIYDKAEIEIIRFTAVNVLSDSLYDDDDELPFVSAD